jgi:hypothetical protein
MTEFHIRLINFGGAESSDEENTTHAAAVVGVAALSPLAAAVRSDSAA